MRFACTANLNSRRSINHPRKTLEAIVFEDVLLTSTSSPLLSKFQKAIIRGHRATREPPIALLQVSRIRWRLLELAPQDAAIERLAELRENHPRRFGSTFQREEHHPR